MYIVYILRDSSKKLYKGFTKDLEKRLKDHKYGRTKTTKSMKDLRVVYIEKYDSLNEAINRERYLKTASGRRFIKNLGL